MGYSIQANTASGVEIDYFHYNSKETDRPLHKVLGVGYLKDQTRLTRPYSLGNLLEAKSKLMDISNTLGEQDFLDRAISEAKDSRKPIYITFN